jgi:hypothetical protein
MKKAAEDIQLSEYFGFVLFSSHVVVTSGLLVLRRTACAE